MTVTFIAIKYGSEGLEAFYVKWDVYSRWEQWQRTQRMWSTYKSHPMVCTCEELWEWRHCLSFKRMIGSDNETPDLPVRMMTIVHSSNHFISRHIMLAKIFKIKSSAQDNSRVLILRLCHLVPNSHSQLDYGNEIHIKGKFRFWISRLSDCDLRNTPVWHLSPLWYV